MYISSTSTEIRNMIRRLEEIEAEVRRREVSEEEAVEAAKRTVPKAVPEAVVSCETVSKFDLEREVSKMLKELGMPSHVLGYRYTRTALIMVLKEPSMLDAITKELYPEIAQMYGTSSSRTERAIRHAIEIAWERGNQQKINELFAYSVTIGKKPTNSHFIATLADELRLLMRR